MYDNSKGNPLYEIANAKGVKVYSTPIEAEFVPTEAYYNSTYSGIPATWQSGLKGASDYINAQDSSDTFGIIFVNDIHDSALTLQNYIESIITPSRYSRWVWGGDNCHKYDTIQGAIDRISGQTLVRRLVVMGNHEHWLRTANPKDSYAPLLDSRDVLMDGDKLVYYSDDDANNVRYIVMDSTYHLNNWNKFDIPSDEVEWIKSALPNDKDVILIDHCNLAPFCTFVDSTNHVAGDYIGTSDESTLIQQKIIHVIRAWQKKGNRFVGYLTGHYHIPGYRHSDGFNMFTGASPASSYVGTQFYLVNKADRTITILVCPKVEQGFYKMTCRW